MQGCYRDYQDWFGKLIVTMELSAEELAQAATLLGWDGEVVGGVSEGDRRLSAVATLDRAEIARREGSCPVTDQVLLSALMNLPHGQRGGVE